jgi:hypothetical protein
MLPLQLPPLRRNFLERMTVAHWLLLAYPVFLAIVARRRDADDVFTIDSSAIMQIGFVVMMGLFCVVRLITHGRALLRVVFSWPAGWIAAYALFAFASAAWSSRPDFTLYRAVEMTVFLLVTVEAVYRLADVTDVLRFQLLYAFVVAVVWHLGDLRYDMSWEILHNSLVPGANIGVLAIFAGAAISGRFWWTAFLVVGASFLVGTSSASYLSLLFGVGCLMMFHTGAQRVVGALLAATTGVAIWGYGLDWGALVFWGKNEYAITSASGRIPVWQWLLDSVVSQRPLFGYGFGVGESIVRLAMDWAGLRMMHMHNAAMSAVVNLGAAGLVLFLLFLVSIVVSLWKIRSAAIFPYAFAAFTAVLLNSMSMSSITAPVSLGWVGHMLLYLYLVRLTRTPAA